MLGVRLRSRPPPKNIVGVQGHPTGRMGSPTEHSSILRRHNECAPRSEEMAPSWAEAHSRRRPTGVQVTTQTPIILGDYSPVCPRALAILIEINREKRPY